MIGVILPLSEEAYRFFLCLSKAMSKVRSGTIDIAWFVSS